MIQNTFPIFCCFCASEKVCGNILSHTLTTAPNIGKTYSLLPRVSPLRVWCFSWKWGVLQELHWMPQAGVQLRCFQPAGNPGAMKGQGSRVHLSPASCSHDFLTRCNKSSASQEKESWTQEFPGGQCTINLAVIFSSRGVLSISTVIEVLMVAKLPHYFLTESICCCEQQISVECN